MMLVFFLGIGAASILAGFAETPLQLGACLLLVGAFASIYHPVGIAMVVHGRQKTGMPLAVNGVFGNLGVASAALVAGFLIDRSEEHTSELQSLMRSSYAVFCLKKKKKNTNNNSLSAEHTYYTV